MKNLAAILTLLLALSVPPILNANNAGGQRKDQPRISPRDVGRGYVPAHGPAPVRSAPPRAQENRAHEARP